MTKRQVERRGLKVYETKNNDVTPLVEPIDPNTGNKMPAREAIPTPGFNKNVGESYFEGIGDTLTERAGNWKKEIADSVLKEMVEKPEFDRYLADPSGKFPVARTADNAVLVLREKELTDTLRGITREDVKKVQEAARELTGTPEKVPLSDGGEVELSVKDEELVVVAVKDAGPGYKIPQE